VRVIVFGALLVAAAAWLGGRSARAAEFTIAPDEVVGRIDEKIYGQFLEHIYHSVNGGLWGEMIWDRSFEGGAAAGGAEWRTEGAELVQEGPADNVRLVFGDRNWTDYEFTLQARKTGGEEGFLVLFRVVDDKQFYWVNLGGWGNARHAVERSIKGQARWGTVGPRPAGKIDEGRWYRIRVRCQGPHFQVWLDDQRIIDFTDDAQAHLAGRVGVGTWRTQARFRNIRVSSLDGKTLLEGLPPLPPQAGGLHSWQPYGPGKVGTVSAAAEALNGEKCREVVSDGGETGLAQTPLAVRAGETYYGSLWARGEAAADGLVVRLLDGTKTLAEKTLAKTGDAWHDLLFEFKPDAGCDNATIQVGLRGKGRVWFDQVSLMAESSRKTGGFRPDLLKAIADLRPPVIRWPGGCYASLYRWKDGIGPQHQRVKYPRPMWDDVDVNSFGTDEFLRLCRAVGAEPLIVINIGMHDPKENRSSYLRDACDWVRYCNGPAASEWGGVRAANGHPEPYKVRYWEIDNETWRLAPDEYAAAVREFVPAMKKADPGIIVAACGSGGLGPAGRGQEYNRAVIRDAAKHFDYISTHHYENPANYASGPERAEAFLRETGGIIAASANPGVRIYHSEWNAQSTDWRTGLYAGGLLNAFERLGDIVGMAGPALFLRHVSARAWDNAFINFDHRIWFPAPNYVVMKLWRVHYAPLRVKMTGDAGPLSAVATKAEDGKTLYLKAVNPTGEAAAVALVAKEGFAVGGASMQLVAADTLDARNTLDEPERIRPVAAPVEVLGQTVRFSLPRYSAAAVTIRRR